MSKHRPPTASDIGKTVEVSIDGTTWEQAEILALHYDDEGFVAYTDYVNVKEGGCRVPYSAPDPVAELSISADWLAERGMDEAARVLMQFLAMDGITQTAFLAYRPGDSVTLYQTLLNELEPSNVR